MNKKFAVKVHNEYLSEAVQKLAFKYGYKCNTKGEYIKPLSDMSGDMTFLVFNYYNNDNCLFWSRFGDDCGEIYSAKTDWDKIEKAMKPVEPPEIS